jgi:hypothetical protein
VAINLSDDWQGVRNTRYLNLIVYLIAIPTHLWQKWLDVSCECAFPFCRAYEARLAYPPMLQPLIQIDVGIEQQADAAALAPHPAKPLRVGDALVALHHLQLHRGLRQRRRVALLEQHHLADGGMVEVAAQAFVELLLAPWCGCAVGLGVEGDVHGSGPPGGGCRGHGARARSMTPGTLTAIVRAY